MKRKEKRSLIQNLLKSMREVMARRVGMMLNLMIEKENLWREEHQ
jgi:hypothetical protein